jgi:hypothetical protein
MVQVIQDEYRGSPVGRLGKGIGKGLSEQVPKEIERLRLSSGLKNLAEKSEGLTPLQAYAQFSSIPGITPAMIQALPEILKQQNIRSSYSKKGKSFEKQEASSPQKNLENIKFGQLPGQIQKQVIQGQSERPSDFANEEVKATSEPTIRERNPLSPELIPAKPWTAERRDQEISRLQEELPYMTFPEIRELAAENEKRELAQPGAEQAIDQYYQQIKDNADAEFDKQFQIKTQRKGEKTFEVLPGEMQLALKRGMANDLIKNPNLSVEKAGNKWSEIGLNNAKALTELEALSKHPITDSPSIILNKLKSLQVPFAKAGNKESYQGYLERDFKLSPQRAAELAYPKSKKVSEYVNETKRSPSIPEKFREISRKRAIDIQSLITPEDSILAIARSLKDKDPYFDENSFFNQLREDQMNIGLTPRQQRELSKGESSFFPNWADLWYFPWPTGIKIGPVEK